LSVDLSGTGQDVSDACSRAGLHIRSMSLATRDITSHPENRKQGKKKGMPVVRHAFFVTGRGERI